MKILILTDIHGNLPALESVLADPRAAACDVLVSCGDHTGFGPCPRETQLLLQKQHAILLAGNHDERIAKAFTPEFAGYNWTLLHWTARQMAGLDTVFPRTCRIGDVLFAHAVPDDPNRLLHRGDLPDLLRRLPAGVRGYVSGHNHSPWHVELDGRFAFNPGSLGVSEDGVGGQASFGILTLSGAETRLERCLVPYDRKAIFRAYAESGAAQAAPEMCRIIYETMLSGSPEDALKFIRLACVCGEALGTSVADPAAMKQAARQWQWPEDTDCETFWRTKHDDP